MPLRILLLMALLGVFAMPLHAQVKAFPTAEGFGAGSVGGRGGVVMKVTNLNDSGPGSFRACAEATVPRTCVFEVGGRINLQSSININGFAGQDSSYLTIAGQTAPSPGILLGPWSIFIAYGVHDVIIRHISHVNDFPDPGPPDQNADCGNWQVWGALNSHNPDVPTRNIILDHVSAGYGCDDSIQAGYGYSDNVTIQWSIIADPYHHDMYAPGQDAFGDSKGMFSGGSVYDGQHITLHHNLLVHAISRNPTVGAVGTMDFRNNIAYNYFGCEGVVELGSTDNNDPQPGRVSHINFVGNKYIPGPDNLNGCNHIALLWKSVDTKVYVESNVTPYCPGSPACAQFEWSLGLLANSGAPNFIYENPASEAAHRSFTPFAGGPYPVTMTALSQLEAELATKVGMTVPRRHELDTRAIQEFTSRAGHIGRTNFSTGVYDPVPPMPFAQRPAGWDTDGDGIPNQWESDNAAALGLNPNNGSDGAELEPGGSGYTKLEMYLNELAGDGVVEPGVNPTANPIYLSGGGHGDTPSDGDGSVQSCINAENAATPKATWVGALACMVVPGKELRIRGGTYAVAINTLSTPITGGNSWLTPTRLTAYQNETVIIALPVGQTVAMFHQNAATDHYILATGLTIDGMNRTGNNALVFYPGTHHIRYENTTIKNTANGFECVYVGDADNIELKSVTIQNCGSDAIGVQGTVDGLLVETSTIQSTLYRAIGANADSGSNTNLILSRNRIHSAGMTATVPAVVVGPGTGALLVNNLLYDHDAGIEIRSGAAGTKLYHNTIASTTGVGIQCNSGASGVLLTNNIAFTTGGGILNNCGATLTTNLTTDPLFTNAAGDIYTLQTTPTASPGINMGTHLPAVTVAFDGIFRPQGPQVDIGAYEQNATGPPLEPTGMGPLVIHAGNPRYFAKPNGDLVLLAGAYDWDFAFRMSDSDADDYTDFWVLHGMNLIRVPTNDPTFATSSPPGSTPFDSVYFAKLVERVTLAHSKGLYVQISMLEHINQPPFNDIPYIENYLRHVVDQVGMFENVLFEIGNELQTEGFDGGTVGSFLTQMVNVVNAQQAANGFTGAARKPVGISDFPTFCGFGVCPAVVDYMKNSPADFIQLGRSEVGQHVDDTPADLAGVRVSIVDSDHIWPYNLNHTWAWRTFMRGHNVQLLDGNEFIPDHSEDDNDVVSVPTFDARMRIGDIRAFALRMDLTQAIPNASITTTGYALANPGVEYLIYQPGNGPFNVTLVPATYTVEWWDASAQTSIGAAQITATGVTTFTPPFAGDAVLFLQTGPPPEVVSPTNAVQALMFF